MRSRNWNRICVIYGKTVDNYMFPTTSKNQDDYSFHGTIHLHAFIDAHAEWIQPFLDAGWDGYLFSVMFHELGGSRKTKLIQMSHEVEQIYNRLVTRMVRDPRSQSWAGYLPVGVFVPDLPVPKVRKAKKSTIKDVSINDGLHMGGIVLGNRWGRIRTSLDEYFEKKKKQYLSDKVRDIHVERIKRTPDSAVGYTFKSLLKRTSTPDDVLVLNWGGSAQRPDALREIMRRSLGKDRTIWGSSDRTQNPVLGHV